MGYTHYFEGKVNLDESTLASIQLLIDQAQKQGIAIRGGLGSGEPEVTSERVRFNGDASTDDDYETFSVGDSSAWTFCKTARRPYDAVVGSVLLLLASLNPEFVVTSDGDATDPGDWGDATTLFSSTFDMAAPVELVNR